MAEGFKQITISSQERAISSDVNRLQKTTHRDVAELLRYMLDVTGNDDLDAGSVIAEPASVETPLRAEIINGLLARPQAASTSVFIDPGVVMLMAPDGGADESNYKYIRDTGTVVPGALVIAAGAVATRIDVVECRMNPVDLTATESRDVFDTTTGLFAATVVTKERQGRLEYRVRAGIAGAGYPGSALGWLPLMIASVPLTAVTNNDCTFWDVRPLISDRVYGSSALSNDRAEIRDGIMTASRAVAPAELRLNGAVEVAFNGRRAGGRIRRGTPGATDPNYVDLAHANNLDPGAVFGINAPWYVYLCFPHGLPRWARYSIAPTMLPRSPRGIPVTATTAPLVNGRPSVAITIPTGTGLVTTTTSAAVILSGLTGPGVTLAPDDVSSSGPSGKTVCASSRSVAATAFGATELVFPLSAGVDYPTNAKALLVTLLVAVTTATPTFGQVLLQTRDPVGPTVVTEVRLPNRDFDSGVGTYALYTVEVPVISTYPAAPASPTMQVRLNYVTGATVTGGTLLISGWVI